MYAYKIPHVWLSSGVLLQCQFRRNNFLLQKRQVQYRPCADLKPHSLLRLLNKRGFVWKNLCHLSHNWSHNQLKSDKIVRHVPCLCTDLLIHATVYWPLFLICTVAVIILPRLLPPSRMACISVCRAWWTGSGRFWEFPWKRNTTVCCSEVD